MWVLTFILIISKEKAFYKIQHLLMIKKKTQQNRNRRKLLKRLYMKIHN